MSSKVITKKQNSSRISTCKKCGHTFQIGERYAITDTNHHRKAWCIEHYTDAKGVPIYK